MNLNGRLSYEGNVSGSLGAELVADVEANPSGPATQTLVKIRVGDVIYSIPSGGGGGGTSDYNLLNNKPKINNIILEGELTLSDLGVQEAITFPGDGSKYLNGEGSFTTPSAPHFIFSTTEFDTGKRWYDGSVIYGIVIPNLSISVPSNGTWAYTGVMINNLKQIILGLASDGTNNWFAEFLYASPQIVLSAPYGFTLNNLYLEYTKNE